MAAIWAAREQPGLVGDGKVGSAVAGGLGYRVGHAPGLVLLEEVLALYAVRAAQDGQRPAGDAGQGAFGDRLPVSGEVGLGETLAVVRLRPELALGMA